MKIYIDQFGYKRFTESDQLVHRVIAYEKIFKDGSNFLYRFSDYVVHHKNGNKTDNRVSNLQVVTQEEHAKIHGLIYNQPLEEPYVMPQQSWLEKVLLCLFKKWWVFLILLYIWLVVWGW